MLCCHYYTLQYLGNWRKDVLKETKRRIKRRVIISIKKRRPNSLNFKKKWCLKSFLAKMIIKLIVNLVIETLQR